MSTVIQRPFEDAIEFMFVEHLLLGMGSALKNNLYP